MSGVGCPLISDGSSRLDAATSGCGQHGEKARMAGVTSEGKIVNHKRRLVFRFHSLPYVAQMEIVTKLKLVAEEDRGLKEVERQVRYFRRAEQNDILDQFWTAVEQQHGKDLGDNPFAKKA